MKEQSHKNEMRAALRGDFERLRARRQDGPPTVVAATPEPVTETAPEPASAPAATQVSWLDRLRGAR